jgi:hypothetical protein
MTTNPETLATQLVTATCEHADNAGDGDFICGDLELLLAAAFRVMPAAVQRKFWRQPELADLADLPEFGSLIRRHRNKR